MSNPETTGPVPSNTLAEVQRVRGVAEEDARKQFENASKESAEEVIRQAEAAEKRLEEEIQFIQEEEKQSRVRLWGLVHRDEATGKLVCEVISEQAADAVAEAVVQAEANLADLKEMHRRRENEASRKIDGLKLIFGAALAKWTKDQLAWKDDDSDERKKKRKKSYKLEHGVVGFRHQPDKTETIDQAALNAWAEESCMEAVTYPVVVSVQVVDDWEKKHKKLAPGRNGIPEWDKFYVRAPRAPKAVKEPTKKTEDTKHDETQEVE